MPAARFCWLPVTLSGLKKLLASAASAKQSTVPVAGVETVASQPGAQPGTSGSPVVSEYARWAVQAVPQRVPEPSAVQCWVGEFANAKEVCCDRSQGPLGRSQCWDGMYTFAACCGDESGNSDGAELQHVYEQDAEEAARQSRKVKGRLFAIERKLAAVESGLRWFSLVEKCVERRFLGKDFKLCFFQDARQGSVHVGSFDGWEGTAMLYTGGQRCPAGPARSVKVWLTCSGEVGSLSLILRRGGQEKRLLTVQGLNDVSEVAGCVRGLALHLRGRRRDAWSL